MHLEGIQSVLGALQARARKIQVVLVRSNAQKERYRDAIELAESQNVPVKQVSAPELDAMTHGKTHGGIVAVCGRKPVLDFDAVNDIVTKSFGPPLLLILEGVEDLQHLGYVLRTAEALGVTAVLLKKHLWDFDETGVSRASSGAFERLPVIRFSEASRVTRFQRFDIKLWGCIARSKRTIYDVDLNRPVALAIGGEKRGLSGALRQHCDGFIRIPMVADSASSLSLTHAACLVLGEAFRQRYQARTEEAGIAGPEK